jgi:Protein of unknown function with HXXEE motif
MDLLTLIWLFPVVFIFHDFEEIIMMEKWVKRNSSTITEKLPPRIARRVIRQFSLSTAQFAAAVLVVFLFVSVSTFMASQYVNDGDFRGNIYMFTVLQLVFFIHVFTHVGQSILFRCVTPGVITSVLFVLPYSTVMLRELLIHELITWHTIFISLPFVFLMLPIVLFAHWIGKKTA